MSITAERPPTQAQAAEPQDCNLLPLSSYPAAVGSAKPHLSAAIHTLRSLSEQAPDNYWLASAFRDALRAMRALNRPSPFMVLPGWSECPACSSENRDVDALCVYCGQALATDAPEGGVQ